MGTRDVALMDRGEDRTGWVSDLSAPAIRSLPQCGMLTRLQGDRDSHLSQPRGTLSGVRRSLDSRPPLAREGQGQSTSFQSLLKTSSEVSPEQPYPSTFVDIPVPQVATGTLVRPSPVLSRALSQHPSYMAIGGSEDATSSLTKTDMSMRGSLEGHSGLGPKPLCPSPQALGAQCSPARESGRGLPHPGGPGGTSAQGQVDQRWDSAGLSRTRSEAGQCFGKGVGYSASNSNSDSKSNTNSNSNSHSHSNSNSSSSVCNSSSSNSLLHASAGSGSFGSDSSTNEMAWMLPRNLTSDLSTLQHWNQRAHAFDRSPSHSLTAGNRTFSPTPVLFSRGGVGSRVVTPQQKAQAFDRSLNNPLTSGTSGGVGSRLQHWNNTTVGLRQFAARELRRLDRAHSTSFTPSRLYEVTTRCSDSTNQPASLPGLSEADANSAAETPSNAVTGAQVPSAVRAVVAGESEEGQKKEADAVPQDLCIAEVQTIVHQSRLATEVEVANRQSCSPPTSLEHLSGPVEKGTGSRELVQPALANFPVAPIRRGVLCSSTSLETPAAQGPTQDDLARAWTTGSASAQSLPAVVAARRRQQHGLGTAWQQGGLSGLTVWPASAEEEHNSDLLQEICAGKGKIGIDLCEGGSCCEEERDPRAAGAAQLLESCWRAPELQGPSSVDGPATLLQGEDGSLHSRDTWTLSGLNKEIYEELCLPKDAATEHVSHWSFESSGTRPWNRSLRGQKSAGAANDACAAGFPLDKATAAEHRGSLRGPTGAPAEIIACSQIGPRVETGVFAWATKHRMMSNGGMSSSDDVSM